MLSANFLASGGLLPAIVKTMAFTEKYVEVFPPGI
jgi:hypothetical protein